MRSCWDKWGTPILPKKQKFKEFPLLGAMRGGGLMRLVTRIAAAIGSLATLLFAGGAPWRG